MFLKKQQVSCFFALAAALLAHSAWPQTAAEKKADPPAAQDDPYREVLRLAKLPTEGPGLLGLLEKLGGKDEDLLRLDGLIAQLGDAQFARRAEAARKIVALNQAAIARLKTAQLAKDQEIASRAKDCLKEIFKGQKLGIPLTAVRVLARQRPDGLAEALLRFLPYTVEEEVQEEVWFTLYDLVKETPRLLPLMEKALQDPLAARRAVAGCVLGRLGNKDQQKAVAKLLDDADPHVRLRSAQGLLAGKNLAGVRTLIELLEQPAVEISWSAEELLHWMAGDDAPAEKVGAARDKERLASRKAWETWWGKRQKKFSFAEVEKEYRRPGLLLINTPPVHSTPAGLNYTIWTCGCDGKTRWEMEIPWFTSARLLPGNRFLIVGACPPGIAVCERDLHGKVLWNPRTSISYPSVNGMDVPPQKIDDVMVKSCTRLVNGNTYLSLYLFGAIEIDHEGNQVSLIELPIEEKESNSRPRCLRLLSNGRLLAIWPGNVFDRDKTAVIGEYDPESGLSLRRIKIQALDKTEVHVIDALPNGNYIIDRRNRSFWEEIDHRGKVVRELPLFTYTGIERLRNGNVLGGGKINHTGRIFETSPDGRLLWELLEFGFPKDLLSLIRLGFDAPRPADLDLGSIASRIEQLRSKDSLVRRVAATDLRVMGPKAAPAIPALYELIDDPRKLYPGVDNAISILRIFEEIGPAAFPVILKAAHHEQTNVRAAALADLSRFTDKTNILVPLWLDGLKDKDADIRRAALDGLAGNLFLRIRQKDDVTEAERKQTIRRVADAMSDPELSERACDRLGGLGPEAIPHLVQALKGKNLALRIIAAHSVGDVGPDAAVAIPDLLDAFQARDVEDKTIASSLRWNIIDAFRRIGPKASQTTSLITQILGDKNYKPDMRRMAVDALRSIGERSAPIEQALMEATNDDDEHLRMAATLALKDLRARKPR